MLVVTVVGHGSALQVPHVVEELLELALFAGSALQVPQAVEELLELALFAGSALQVPQVVEELELFVGSALQVAQVELLAEEDFVGSALHAFHVPVALPELTVPEALTVLPELKPLLAELQVELVQVPKPLSKV